MRERLSGRPGRMTDEEELEEVGRLWNCETLGRVQNYRLPSSKKATSTNRNFVYLATRRGLSLPERPQKYKTIKYNHSWMIAFTTISLIRSLRPV